MLLYNSMTKGIKSNLQ